MRKHKIQHTVKECGINSSEREVRYEHSEIYTEVSGSHQRL